MMTQDKAWYRSRTIWGGLVALAAALAGLFGIETNAEAGVDLAAALTDAIAALGAVVAVLGRFDAKATIG